MWINCPMAKSNVCPLKPNYDAKKRINGILKYDKSFFTRHWINLNHCPFDNFILAKLFPFEHMKFDITR